MKTLKDIIQGKLLVVGIGNTLRRDDGAGCEVVNRYRREYGAGNPRIRTLDAGTAPENFVREIMSPPPETILFIDAAETGGSPGAIQIFTEKDIVGVGISTHNLSLKTFITYLKGAWPDKKNLPDIYVAGIQTKTTKFGEGLSEPVSSAVDILVGGLAEPVRVAGI